MFESELSPLVITALARLHTDLRQHAPQLAAAIQAWTQTLAQTEATEAYFLRPLGFPLLYLPWWLEKTLTTNGQATPTLQTELVYSSVNGYYFIRLIDNLMDGHATVEKTLLPVLGFFHTQFQTVYHTYFSVTHPFWAQFRAFWFGMAEVTMQDAALDTITHAQFEAISGQKVCASKIPLAAVCHYHQRPEVFAAWAQFVDGLGQWHQLRNDVFDWGKDLRLGTRTYFLSEAAHRAQPGEAPAVWVVREGFRWGVEQLETRLTALRAMAEPLGSADLLAYLDLRAAMLRQDVAEIGPDLQKLAQLAAAWKVA